MGTDTTIPQVKRGARRESTQRRRRDILDAALECFLANGVEAATIGQIRAVSKASHGSIYHLFGSKDEIALTLFVEGMRAYHERMLAAIESSETARGKIRAIIATHLRGIVDDPRRALYLTRLGMADDVGEISQQYRSMNGVFAQAIWEHLRPFVARGEIARLSQELYFPLIIGPCAHLSRSWLRSRIDCDLLAATDDLADAAWKSLQVDQANGARPASSKPADKRSVVK